MEGTDYYRYWGKAGKGEDAKKCHLLVYHCLDVAAVAFALLDGDEKLSRMLSEPFMLEGEQLHRWVAFLIALHDLGKFSGLFQKKRPDIESDLGHECSRGLSGKFYHDTWGLLLSDELFPLLVPNAPSDEMKVLAAAVMGHHGQPAKREGLRVRRLFSEEDKKAAAGFSTECMKLFGIGPEIRPFPERNDEQLLKNLSWRLAGLTVLADWVGSNERFFPFVSRVSPLKEYWNDHALPRARKAVKACNLEAAVPSGPKQGSELFPYLKEPTPLQSLAESTDLDEGPKLFILEDVTGAGKTEAAFILAHRLMASNEAEGVYVALPTMATANAMYGRTRTAYPGFFREGETPSLVLAHGDRHLVDDFRASVFGGGTWAVEGKVEDELKTASARCSSWLADNNKKALLASMGVGTIDQALLAVLKSKHQSLRLFGLRNKVLIVDEVHACDAYMNRLLAVLLAAHASAGGSVVLLSATLPMEARRKLVEGFARGAGLEAPLLQREEYPLFTCLSGKGAREIPVPTRKEVKRDVAVTLLGEKETILTKLCNTAKSRGCAVWVRNTVADALEGWLLLKEALPEGEVILFHARFAMGDRLDREKEVERFFGKESKGAERAGKIVVATQVIEQSLDVDFDELVSDLAPLDSLFQRFGRYRRHRRDADGNRLEGDQPDGRGKPEVFVYGPLPEENVEADWYKKVFEKGAYVYSDHALLWRTAKQLATKGRVRVPEDLRAMMEAAFDPFGQVPEALAESGETKYAQDLSDSSLALFNTVNLEGGYAYDGEFWSESFTPTRLGEKSLPVRLATWDGVRLRSWREGDRHPWNASEVNVRASLADGTWTPDDGGMKEAVESLLEEWRVEKEEMILAVLEKGENGILTARTMRKGREVLLAYDPETGLEIVPA